MLGKLIVLQLASLVAPVVTLFYRKGIWLTPDDPVSPYGCATTPGASREQRMVWIYDHFPKWFGDWYWLGIRNAAYGLAYKWKPDVFKNISTYGNIKFEYSDSPRKRVITASVDTEKYTETTYRLKICHIIVGYRIRPMWETAHNGQPIRPINMDGRPIFSIRFGNDDD